MLIAIHLFRKEVFEIAEILSIDKVSEICVSPPKQAHCLLLLYYAG